MSDEGTPLVSVVVPTHNRAGLLPAALRSALGQTLHDLEVIVVDDGSTDDTPEVVARLAAADTRVRIHRQDNRGPSTARNTGIALSQAAWIAFLDDDDLWVGHALQRLLARATATTEVVASLAQRFVGMAPDLDADQVLANPRNFRLESWLTLAPTDRVGLHELLLRPAFPIHAAIFRRTTLQEVGGFDERLATPEDYDLWLRLAARNPIPVVPEVLALVRWHDAQRSRPLGWQAKSTRQIIERFVAAHPESWRLAGRSALRRRLALLAREEAYAALLAGEVGQSRAAAAVAVRYWPWAVKPWAYLALSHSPGTYRRLRGLLHRHTVSN